MEDPKRVEEGFGRTPLDHDDDKDGNKCDNGECFDNNANDDWTAVNGERKGEDQPPPSEKPKTKRVATLDAFRGLTIVMMILVDHAGIAYPALDHAPWDGCMLADFVMPFFLFIVGVAVALALKKILKIKDAIYKITLRTLKLLFLGILLQGGYSHALADNIDLAYGVDMKLIRWCGILQRIALVYFVVALIETLTTKRRPLVLSPGHVSIFTAYRWQWIGGFIAFSIYMITTYSLYIPDWSFVDHKGGKTYTVKCGTRGHLGPACNAVGYVDREILGINHLYKSPVWQHLKACTLSSPRAGPFRYDASRWCHANFEPEGLLSSVSAILSGTIGIHYGHVLIHFKGHSQRLKQWVSMGFGLLILAFLLHFTHAIPINKQLYTISYVCLTAGAAGIVFSGFYIVIDVWGFRTPFVFLEWIGMNSMLIFVLGAQGILAAFINGWYYNNPNDTLVTWIQRRVFIDVWKSRHLGTLFYVIFAEIIFYGVLAGILHKLGMYWKL
ncbi:heparan-alpha-glucosaminide N-acetyltransferase-like [Hibiscus syriacus]|uniref:heparan-alpha-glucosaminide N-acetyltransferase-like n=1 Tax=Hibiscus syriacus TaxID=106335 RepID=UPI0019216E66|nr:heparan-alpha-glucosaminide N-acetyltransferase-like [Hibiscus syriacus]